MHTKYLSNISKNHWTSTYEGRLSNSLPRYIKQAFSHLLKARSYAYLYLFAPRNIESEILRRREYMTNVLLSGLALLFIGRLLITLSAQDQQGILLNDSSNGVNIALLIIVCGFWRWSRHGHVQAAALGVISLLTLQTLSLNTQWGFEFPFSLLMTTVVVLACGVLLSTRAAIAATSVILTTLLLISHAQRTGSMAVDLRWMQEPFTLRGAISLTGVIVVVAVVTWIMNIEINRSIKRIAVSELALQVERDMLEQRVKDRTKQIEELQLARSLEIQRFAEFGRLSANLLHEISNPLTAAYLNLAAYSGNDSESVRLARKNLKQLERYTIAARSQLKDHGQKTNFKPSAEINKVKLVLEPLAVQSGVTLHYSINHQLILYGDAIKFSQILSNLLANAIDAYETIIARSNDKKVFLTMAQKHNSLLIRIYDHGIGIEADNLETIFDPFYSTKSNEKRGLGIGLSMVKRMVEEDFGGTITVESTPSTGTIFEVRLPLPQAQRTRSLS